MSTKLEAHIASSDDCTNECFANTEGNKYDNKIDVHRTVLSILNFQKKVGIMKR